MKIDRLSSPATTAARRGGRKRDAESGGFAEALDSHESAGASALGGGRGLGGVESLLAVQEAMSEPGADQRARQRGEDLLDRLDELQLGLLSGRLSRAAIERLALMAKARRGGARDPRLAAILDEIELRAAVELAKFGR